MRDEPNQRLRCQNIVHQIPQRVLTHFDSRKMVMEVEILKGVCNNSPAECISPENGWRLNGIPIPLHCSYCDASVSRKAWGLVSKVRA